METIQDEETMEMVIQLVASHLQSPWTRQRAPKGLQAAYLQAQNAPLESTARIFLDVGFLSWVAYFLATPGETHFSGRNYQTSQLKAFDNLSKETRVSAAKRVAGSSINPTTLEAINGMERSCKRQKTAQQSNPTREEPVESSPTPPPETPAQSQDQINTNAAPATGSAVDKNYHFSRAAPQAIANLVPSTLNYAIRRDTTADYQTAAVTMGFPRDPVKMQYCITTIDIIQKKVEYYALKLYGIQIETEGGKRYAVLAGVRIDPEHSMTFRRCRTACIKELFGKQIDEAIDTCPFRLAEYEFGRLIETDCVTMTINSDAKGGAMISLYMGLHGGTEIRDSLYPKLRR